MKNTFVIHDLLDTGADGALKHNITELSAVRKSAPCKGCFGCWLKTPGTCVMFDGLEQIGTRLATSSDVVIITKSVYGGFSKEIKRIMDRSIGGILPFFATRNGEMHHAPRYDNKANLFVVYYEASTMTSDERALAEKLARAVATNFNAASCTVYFKESDTTLEEVLETCGLS